MGNLELNLFITVKYLKYYCADIENNRQRKACMVHCVIRDESSPLISSLLLTCDELHTLRQMYKEKINYSSGFTLLYTGSRVMCMFLNSFVVIVLHNGQPILYSGLFLKMLEQVSAICFYSLMISIHPNKKKIKIN